MTRPRALEAALLRRRADAAWRHHMLLNDAAEAAEAEYPGGVENMWEVVERAYQKAARLQSKVDVLPAVTTTPAQLLLVVGPFRHIEESAGRDFLVEVDAAAADRLREAQLEAAIGGRFWRVRPCFQGVKNDSVFLPSQQCEAMVLAVGPTRKGLAEVLMRCSGPDAFSQQAMSEEDKDREAEF